MSCDDVRLSLSARLDGEAMPLRADEVDEHLAGCATCRAWLAGAEQVTRAVRVQAVEVPDLTTRIMTALYAEKVLPIDARRPARTNPVKALRWSLAALALLQLVMAVPTLFGAVGQGIHAGRETAAFDIALSVGLLVVASYPEYARVFTPVVLTLVVGLASASAVDMPYGLVSTERVATHLITVAQLWVLWLLSRHSRRPTPSLAETHK